MVGLNRVIGLSESCMLRYKWEYSEDGYEAEIYAITCSIGHTYVMNKIVVDKTDNTAYNTITLVRRKDRRNNRIDVTHEQWTTIHVLDDRGTRKVLSYIKKILGEKK